MDILTAAKELPNDWHGAGTVTNRALEALSRYLEYRPVQRSAESGTGRTTLLFSHFSESHTVFTLDDDIDTHSLSRVRGSALLNNETVNFVLGPTQATMPTFPFNGLDFVLIDGPHAYPFPELEYFYIYPHLTEHAILVIDDIHIPTIGNLFRFIEADEMFELREVVDTTAFFERTDAPTFDPFGDNWFRQTYNAKRYPLAYRPGQWFGYKTTGLRNRLRSGPRSNPGKWTRG